MKWRYVVTDKNQMTVCKVVVASKTNMVRKGVVRSVERGSGVASSEEYIDSCGMFRRQI